MDISFVASVIRCSLPQIEHSEFMANLRDLFRAERSPAISRCAWKHATQTWFILPRGASSLANYTTDTFVLLKLLISKI